MNLFKISYSWLEFSDNSIENHWPYTIFQYIKAFESQKKTEKDHKWTARVCHNLVEHMKSSLSNLWQIMLEIYIEVETLQSLAIYWNLNCKKFSVFELLQPSKRCQHLSTSATWLISKRIVGARMVKVANRRFTMYSLAKCVIETSQRDFVLRYGFMCVTWTNPSIK